MSAHDAQIIPIRTVISSRPRFKNNKESAVKITFSALTKKAIRSNSKITLCLKVEMIISPSLERPNVVVKKEHIVIVISLLSTRVSPV